MKSDRPQTGRKYLRHVDGLRAIAIIPVLLFHAGFGPFTGGYIGVDVFFVISGFLISSIILAEKDAGNFSLARFYVRRSRRILPALFAMVAATFAAAWFILLPHEMAAFGASLAAAAAFASNIYFWRTINYFGSGPETLPLLHTWSLAVEEQFYIVFPLALMGIDLVGRHRRSAILGAAFVLSLAFAVWATPRSPAASFYFLPTRAWELLLGTMAVLVADRLASIGRAAREAITAVSVAMIAVPAILYTRQTVFPGAAAVWPCLGTAGLLLFGGGKSAVGWLLRSALAVGIGRLSYSLYLWHWPILAFAHVLWGDQLTFETKLGCLMLTAILASGSFYAVEQPLRMIRGSSRRILSAAAIGSLATAVAGFATASAGGFPSRFPDFHLKDRHLDQLYRVGRCDLTEGQSLAQWDSRGCTTNSTSPQVVVLWGDSFAGHLAPGLRALAEGEGWQFRQYTKDYCPPLFGRTLVQDKTCESFNAGINRVALAGATVILAGRWSSYEADNVLDIARIEETAARLKSRGVHVLVLGASPSFAFGSLDAYLYRRHSRFAPVTFPPSLNQRLKQGVQSADFLDPMRVLCPTYVCMLKDHSGEVYVDSGHLSARGSALMAGAIRERLRASLGPNAPTRGGL